MTVHAVFDEPDDPIDPPDAQQRQAERVVRIIRESFAKIEPQAAKVSEYFYAMLFTLAPKARDMFPANMQVQRSRLLRALVHIVQMVDRPHELTPFLQQLGRDHRKFEVIDQHFDAVGAALVAALKQYSEGNWTDEVEDAWVTAYGIISEAMKSGASADRGPAFWQAPVVDYIKVDWDTAVIRVQPTMPLPYEAGQYLSVEAPQRPRLWRYLSPANAQRDDSTIDFHVRAVHDGWVSRSMVHHTAIGDVWKIGSPLGNLWANRAANRGLVLVGGGTGVAPLRAVIDALARRNQQPQVTLFFGGRTADELYNIDEMRAFAASNAWLSVIPVTEDGTALNGRQGTLADVVTGFGPWRDHDVMVSGSPDMIRATVSRMLVAGTTFDQISYDSFTTD